ncbi:MAG: 1-acyl-sn-glycerol-3-phosphate acyltransferase [Bdellovibrionales bacterium]|nr:1-acyl-sn-glycerol-3-phosphate acyltransferase [Bdellovibrionales bacterium]
MLNGFLRIPRMIFFGALSLFSSLLVGAMTLVFSLIYVVAEIFKSAKWEDWVVTTWPRLSVKIAGLDVSVSGLEKIPKTGGFLYLFNHQSHFDILVCHAVLPSRFRFGAKAELFNVPLFGWALAASGALRIERANLQSVIKVYDVAKERIRRGEKFILAGEGTRHPRDEIGPFKTGPFVLAIQAQSVIVPVVLNSVGHVMHKGWPFIRYDWSRKVSLRVLDPIPTSSFSVDQRGALRDLVRDKMLAAFEEQKQILERR